MEATFTSAKNRIGGAAIVESVIALPLLLMVILSSVQLGLIYEAKATLNYATLLAARSGAVNNASASAIKSALARGLIPLYAPASNFRGINKALTSSSAEVAAHTRIKILNPTQEAFDDFGVDANGEREIPNDRLNMRPTTPGAASGLNIQDANLLRVQATYGYELKVPLARDLFVLALKLTNVVQWRGAAHKTNDGFESQLLAQHRLPLVVTSTVRMQTAARKNDLMIARDALPELERVAFNSNGATATNFPPQQSSSGVGNVGQTTSTPEPDDGNQGAGEGPGDAGSQTNVSAEPFEPGSSSSNAGSGAMCGGSDPNPFELPTSESLPSLTVGNPIHVATGNKYQREVDLRVLGSNLAMNRHYNSSEVTRFGVLGAGWRHDYEYVLAKGSNDRDRWIWQADGRRIHFRKSDRHELEYDAERASDGQLTETDTGTVWEWVNGTRLLFDERGRLYSMRFAQHRLELHYGGHGRLVTVVDERGRALSFDYYANGRLASLSSTDQIIRYGYDGAGNLTQVSYPDKHAKVYRYGNARFPHHLTHIGITEAGLTTYRQPAASLQVAQWEYDSQGRAIMSTHPDHAGQVMLAFNDGFTDVTDAFNRVTRYQWERADGVYRVTSVIGPGCSTCGIGDVHYTYNDRHQVTETRRRDGHAQRIEYDDAGRRLVELSRATTGSDWKLVARYGYDGNSRRIGLIERPSINHDGRHTLTISYSSLQLPERIVERGFEPLASGKFKPLERETRLAYDDTGQLQEVDGPRQNVKDIARYEYGAQRRLANIVGADGTTQRVLTYTRSGLPLRVAQKGMPDVEFEYDAMGRIVAVREVGTSKPRTTRYGFDIAGHVNKVTAPDQQELRLYYDAAGRIDAVADTRQELVRTFKYAPDDRIVETATRDTIGQVLRTLYFSYDAQRRLQEVRDGSGPPLAEYAYEGSVTRPARIRNALGFETVLAYDSLGRLIQETAPDAGSTRFDFEDNVGVRTVVAPNGARTTYVYDDFGRRVREESNDRGITRYAYDEADNLVAKTDARNITIRYEYDATDRLTRVVKPDDVTTLEYLGKSLVSVRGAWGRERYAYDQHRQRTMLLRTVDGHTFRTSYAYDVAGHVTDKWLPDGQHLRYRYDAKGNLLSIAQVHWFFETPLIGDLERKRHAPPRTTQARVYQLIYGNGLVSHTEMDAETGGVRHKSIPGLQSLEYVYDDLGRIKTVKLNDDRLFYTYDRAGRLVRSEGPLTDVEYRYDVAGNRIWESKAAHRSASTEAATLTRAYEYGPASHRLMNVAGEQRRHYRYDAAGNPLSIGNKEYVYDASGRPTKLLIDKRLVAEYRYNAMGERIAKIAHVNGTRTATHYLYEDHRLVAEADARGRITRQYLYLGHHPVVVLDRETPYFIHTDHLGTPQLVTDMYRRIVWKATYQPFGAANVDEDPDRDGRKFELNLRFPGQYADGEAGSHYNLFRDYDPLLGRYLTSDPLGLKGGLSTYSYANNSPLNAIDPLGLKVIFHERSVKGTLYIGGHTYLELIPDDIDAVRNYLRAQIGSAVEQYFFRSLDGSGAFEILSGGPSPSPASADSTLMGSRVEWVRGDDLPGAARSSTVLEAPRYTSHNEGCSDYSDDTIFVGNLILAFLSYQNGPAVAYDGLAGEYPDSALREDPASHLFPLRSGVEYYNSNSLTAGLLIAAGFATEDIPDPLWYQPGLDKPVPISSLKR